MKNLKMLWKNYSKMKIKNIIFKIIVLAIFAFPTHAIEINDHILGSKDAKINIEIFSSLTCPHCAKFHLNVLPGLVKNFVDTKKANIYLKDFPLDLAALNAAKISRCINKKNSIAFLDEIYSKQSEWAVGKNIQEINEKLKRISSKHSMNDQDFDNCIKNEKVETEVLTSRIDAQKIYNITGTPTIIINKKKFEGDYSLDEISKYINKLN